MPSEPKWKVGDPVVVRRPRYSHQGSDTTEHATVARVARKYFYIGTKGRWDEEGYEIETGIQKPRDPNYTNYLAHAYTPAEWEEKQQRDELVDKIRDAARACGLETGIGRWAKNWSTVRLMELLVLLEGVAAEKEVVNLD